MDYTGIQYKTLPTSLDIRAGERAVIASITTDSVDRDGDVLIPSGADLTDFMKSPTVFFNHNYSAPVARAAALKRTARGIEAKTIFASRPTDHVGEWLPDTLFALFQQKVIKGFSVGFVPVSGHPATDADRKRFGAGVRYVFEAWKMLEYSVAPLPSNQDALARLVASYDPTKAFPRLAIAQRRMELIKLMSPSRTPRLDARQRQQEALRAGG